MIKTKFLIFSFVSLLFLDGCDKVLESVILSDNSNKNQEMEDQEEFEINIKSLTFKNAKEANKDPYPRQLMLTGIGPNANVFDEAAFMDSNIPSTSSAENYRLGIGDSLSFIQEVEFAKLKASFPVPKLETDYMLGVGDELTLIQLSGDLSSSVITPSKSNNITNPISTVSGIVGTNGNILLLGLGSIEARNRSLSELQTEIRNIMIRNGLAPNFQLEITGFNSQKAFVTFKDGLTSIQILTNDENVIPITNLPITLKEVLLDFGMKSSDRETLIVTLERNGIKYRMTGEQIFDNSTNLITIENRDQIELSIINTHISPIVETIVGPDGNIFLPTIGSIKAENKSLKELQVDINRILLEQGMVPSFQIAITDFKSKKYFLVTQGSGSQVKKLTDNNLSLKEAVLGANLINKSNFKVINLIRNNKNYQMTFQEMLNGPGSNVLIQDKDTIELKSFEYKPGQVFALSGAGKAKMIPIDPAKRETLADILFSSEGTLNNLMAKRSEVYLLRGRNPSIAYHLDAQNVSRILVAAKTELRPDDIVYVADRTIVSFARTLSEINPLRVLLRDIQNNNIP